MSQEFGAVLAAGLAIFGLVFVASQADFDFSQPQERNEMTVFDKNFGQLGNAQSDQRSISLGSFNVGEGRGDILVAQADRVRVENKFLDKDEFITTYNATQPRSGTVEFEVLGRTNQAQVYVDVNGDRVFEEYLVAEATPTITIPASSLRSGENEIRIGTKQGGWFSSTEYRFEDVKVRINDRKFHDYVDTFKMYRYELEDFLDGTLTFRVTDSVKNMPLKVYVNDQELYSFSTVRGTQEIELTPQNADLRNGLNEIRFETDGESSYSIENANIAFRYVGATQPALVRQQFRLNETQLSFVEGNNTKESLQFQYRNLLGSPRQLSVRVNDLRKSFIPSNGRNTVDLGGQNLEQDNLMVLRSNGSFQLNQVRIRSERPEE